MRKALGLLVMWFLVINANGQSIKYEILKNNPTPFLALHVVPLHADAWQSNFNFGYGARMDAIVMSKFSLGGKYYTSFYSEAPNTFGVTPVELLDNTTHIQLLGRFHFWDKSSTGQNINVSSTRVSHDKVRVSYFYVPDGKVRKYWTLRGGINMLNSGIIVNDAIASDGTTSFAINSTDELRFGNDYVSAVLTNANTRYFSLGLSSIKIYNLVVKSPSYKRAFRDKRVNEFFFDLLFISGTSLDNVNYTDDLSGQNYNLAIEPNALKSMGWRAGWNGTFKFMSFNMEMGTRPGIQNGSQFFAQMGLGFDISSNLNKTE